MGLSEMSQIQSAWEAFCFYRDECCQLRRMREWGLYLGIEATYGYHLRACRQTGKDPLTIWEWAGVDEPTNS